MPPSRMVFICAASFVFAMSGFGQGAPNDRASAILNVRFSGHTAGFWGRYLVSTAFQRTTGWISPSPGEQSVTVPLLAAGPSTRIRAILYVPGCQLQRFDLPITERRAYNYSFQCRALPQTEIAGAITRADRLGTYSLAIKAKYVVGWAPQFFGYNDGTDTVIPLESTSTFDSKNLTFRLSMPDLSKDVLASSQNHQGEIQIWTQDANTGKRIAKLRLISRLPENQQKRFGDLPVGTPQTRLLQFASCAMPPEEHDAYGFGKRPDGGDGCGE